MEQIDNSESVDRGPSGVLILKKNFQPRPPSNSHECSTKVPSTKKVHPPSSQTRPKSFAIPKHSVSQKWTPKPERKPAQIRPVQAKVEHEKGDVTSPIERCSLNNGLCNKPAKDENSQSESKAKIRHRPLEAKEEEKGCADKHHGFALETPDGEIVTAVFLSTVQDTPDDIVNGTEYWAVSNVTDLSAILFKSTTQGTSKPLSSTPACPKKVRNKWVPISERKLAERGKFKVTSMEESKDCESTTEKNDIEKEPNKNGIPENEAIPKIPSRPWLPPEEKKENDDFSMETSEDEDAFEDMAMELSFGWGGKMSI